MVNRTFCLVLAAGITTSPLRAQADPFVGQWKLVKYTDQMTVAKAGANTYAFNFEGGGPEKIVVDGTYQRGIGGTMLSVTPDGPNWKVERKHDGRTMLTAIWTLSKDGNTLTDEFTSFDKNGVPSNTKLVYARAYGSGGLSLIVPSKQATVNVTFDGKNVRRIDARTFEITRRADGRITQIERFVVSPDLKTLTRTVQVVGEDQPLITVFERQD